MSVAARWSPIARDRTTDDARVALGIAYDYGVRHVIDAPSRSALSRYLAAQRPGITRLEAPATLYAIDWTKVAMRDVVLPHGTGAARVVGEVARG